MGKTAKSTRGQEIIIVEVYPDDLSGTLMPGDIEVLKERYGDKPCSYEVQYPWKKNKHFNLRTLKNVKNIHVIHVRYCCE